MIGWQKVAWTCIRLHLQRYFDSVQRIGCLDHSADSSSSCSGVHGRMEQAHSGGTGKDSRHHVMLRWHHGGAIERDKTKLSNH